MHKSQKRASSPQFNAVIHKFPQVIHSSAPKDVFGWDANTPRYGVSHPGFGAIRGRRHLDRMLKLDYHLIRYLSNAMVVSL
jgi:hypothetical protein